jgi:hypothetical protein
MYTQYEFNTYTFPYNKVAYEKYITTPMSNIIPTYARLTYIVYVYIILVALFNSLTRSAKGTLVYLVKVHVP